jgi:fermentation-respiration switch protein FrsA (DUF1100 family)
MLPKRVALIVCAGALVSAVAACDDSGGAPAAAPGPAPELEALVTDRSFAVGYRDMTFVDESRPTPDNGSYPGAPSRTLPTRVWYPTDATPGGDAIAGAPVATGGGLFPLVVFSHGFGANALVYTGVAEEIASHGYVVAAPTYPLTNNQAPGGRNTLDVVNQPGDVSFVIDEVIAADEIGAIVDAERLGVAGHSLGAVTSLAVALNDCCLDDRIDAAVSWAGLTRSLAGSDPFATDVPVLLIHGTDDGVIPYQSSTEAYAGAAPPKFFITLRNGDHYDAYLDGANVQAPIAENATIDFFDRYLKGDDGALARLERDARVPGVSTLQEEPEEA